MSRDMFVGIIRKENSIDLVCHSQESAKELKRLLSEQLKSPFVKEVCLWKNFHTISIILYDTASLVEDWAKGIIRKNEDFGLYSDYLEERHGD